MKNLRQEILNMTEQQRNEFNKIQYCVNRARRGEESAFEFSIIESHIKNGCKLLMESPQQESFVIAEYVKANF